MFHLSKDETLKYVFVTVMTTFKETIEYIDLTRAKSEASVYLLQTSLIQTPKGQNQVSALQRCPYYRGRECMIFGICGTKRTVRNREVSVRRG